MGAFNFWIVNPDGSVAQRWERWMAREGWSAARTPDLRGFLAAAPANGVGMALVDWDCLRGASAPHALRAAKSRTQGISFILTSGVNLPNEQVVQILEAGADDYFPQGMPETLWLAKLKAHLRRLLPSFAQALDVLTAPRGDIKLDQSRKEVRVRKLDGKWANQTGFTPTEMELLALFLKRPGVALERRFIIDSLWRGEQELIRPGTVDKHVESLRRKLGKMGARIRTIYGLGYAYKETER